MRLELECALGWAVIVCCLSHGDSESFAEWAQSGELPPVIKEMGVVEGAVASDELRDLATPRSSWDKSLSLERISASPIVDKLFDVGVGSTDICLPGDASGMGPGIDGVASGLLSVSTVGLCDMNIVIPDIRDGVSSEVLASKGERIYIKKRDDLMTE